MKQTRVNVSNLQICVGLTYQRKQGGTKSESYRQVPKLPSARGTAVQICVLAMVRQESPISQNLRLSN